MRIRTTLRRRGHRSAPVPRTGCKGAPVPTSAWEAEDDDSKTPGPPRPTPAQDTGPAPDSGCPGLPRHKAQAASAPGRGPAPGEASTHLVQNAPRSLFRVSGDGGEGARARAQPLCFRPVLTVLRGSSPLPEPGVAGSRHLPPLQTPSRLPPPPPPLSLKPPPPLLSRGEDSAECACAGAGRGAEEARARAHTHTRQRDRPSRDGRWAAPC